MKIAFFIPSLACGGAEKVIIKIANKCYHEGYDVDLLLAKKDGEYKDQVDNGINIIWFNKTHVVGCLPQITAYLNNNHTNALITAIENCNLVAIFSKILARRNKTTKIIISVHSTLSKLIKESKNIKIKILLVLIKRFYLFADEIIAVSEGIANDLAEILGSSSKINKIYNPIWEDKILEKANEKVDHKWLESKIDTPVILAIGRLSREKNFEMLLDAHVKVRAKFDAKLIILGEGPLRNVLTSKANILGINEYLDMPGFVSNPFAYLSKASVFVLCSKVEGLPNVLIEALACGTPIVSTDCRSGPREILDNGKYGYLVPEGNVLALTERIIDCLSGNTIVFDRNTLLEHLNKFSLDKVINLYISLIKKKGS